MRRIGISLTDSCSQGNWFRRQLEIARTGHPRPQIVGPFRWPRQQILSVSELPLLRYAEERSCCGQAPRLARSRNCRVSECLTNRCRIARRVRSARSEIPSGQRQKVKGEST